MYGEREVPCEAARLNRHALAVEHLPRRWSMIVYGERAA